MNVKKSLCMWVVLVGITGCANTSHHREKTKDFFAQEAELSRSCLFGQEHIPLPEKFVVVPATGQSPFYALANCYAVPLQSIVRFTNPHHAAAADQYSAFLLRLADANDRRAITPQMALAHYNQATVLFNRAVAAKDKALIDASNKEFNSKMSVFLNSISQQMAEQDRQRAANRPVTCGYTGIYTKDRVICQ